MARAVVTGAGGFIGDAVVHELRRRGYDVIPVDVRRGPGIVVADVTRPGGLDKLLVGADLVVHAAAVGTGGGGELAAVRAGVRRRPAPLTDSELRWVTLGGTTGVLDACERADVGRVVHISCVSVLGSSFPDLVDESAPVTTTGLARPDALAAAERAAVTAAARGLPVTVLRVGDAYGPRAGRWTLWPLLLLRAGRFVLVDGGRGLLSPIHVDDLTSAVAAVTEAGETAGEILHVTGGEPVAASDFFGRYARMAGVPLPGRVPAALVRALDTTDRVLAGRGWLSGRVTSLLHPRGYVDLGPLTLAELTRTGTYSIAKVRRLAGWQPRIGLDEGMARTEGLLRERGLLGVAEPARRG
ncbi:NAD-dependent epimerase/dehydratase family protein [Protofrankia symbiont of Coriaria ruscifolia]|uniref:NAD-dependent epimerase/dehydratase family protein n=1 Tax=Protofrankia symbiont of Coriaria ruscifolia TaxID=1306542 RepID=UPI001041401F|nr:NAD-dependent epimerase/dehydratase family protein [Protofrankia symbiont of Coriaria ruscifolia]